MFQSSGSGSPISSAPKTGQAIEQSAECQPEGQLDRTAQPSTNRQFSLPPREQQILRILLLGDCPAIHAMIGRLAISGIADATRWTPLQPTGREGEYITVHTKRMAAERS